MLVIEDDSGTAELLQTFFSSQGIHVSIAKDGQKGLEMANSLAPDIILLDVVMPKKDGITVLKTLRLDGNDVPVIMLSERYKVEQKLTGFEHGADDYVTKPFSPKELLMRVQAILRRTAQTSGACEKKVKAITVGSLTVDPRAREVRIESGGTLPLTKMEFDLLCYLGQRKNEAVTHGELLQNVLGHDPNNKTKALVMHVANIRKKMEASGIEALMLQSVSGVGYKLVE